MTDLPLRLLPGDDLRRRLEAVLREQGGDAGFVVAGIGSLGVARLRLAGADEFVSIEGDIELLSLAGSLSMAGAHLHASVADAAGRVWGGHVMPGCKVRTTAEVLVALLPDWRFTRERDGSTGFAELSIRPSSTQMAMAPLPALADVLKQLEARGIVLPPAPVRLDGYGDSPALSRELIALIRQGSKRAGTSLLWAMEADGDAVPRAGAVEIVIDHLGEPALVTRIVNVQVLAFEDVTAEYAAIEGEGDGSLAYWREAHWRFFGRECKRIGREPAQEMPVVCSVIEVIHDLALPTR